MFDHESGSQEAEEILEDEDEQMADVSEMVDKLMAPIESQATPTILFQTKRKSKSDSK